MYKIIYFSGRVFETEMKLKTVLRTAEKNPNIYQIIRNNADGDLVWEREAPAE